MVSPDGKVPVRFCPPGGHRKIARKESLVFSCLGFEWLGAADIARDCGVNARAGAGMSLYPEKYRPRMGWKW
ncbi:hypothetical protein [Kribbella deserti]|uniref:Uncharacterized protein n=1 Tax=Kribbella deserti TaxID=1926257 RepID=A0ABV6QER0_9ACTN